jgi:hypothetical protein
LPSRACAQLRPVPPRRYAGAVPPHAGKRRLRQAWALEDRDQAIDRLQALALELERSHPGAAGSLREGLAETLTVARLGITGSLKRTLTSTNPCESMIECVRRTSRNVKRWQSGEMALRWTAAGMLEAERQFRRIIGYRDLAKLALAIEGDLARTTVLSPTEETGPDAGTGGSSRSSDGGGGDRSGLRNASASLSRGGRGWRCDLVSCRDGLCELRSREQRRRQVL